MFKYVDALEVFNCKVSESENAIARSVADILNLAKTGGSDAHNLSEVGLFATRFNRNISDESELVDALLSGECEPVVFKKSRGDS
jgi:hypothetical protein